MDNKTIHMRIVKKESNTKDETIFTCLIEKRELELIRAMSMSLRNSLPRCLSTSQLRNKLKCLMKEIITHINKDAI
jgi:hypothetical protein